MRNWDIFSLEKRIFNLEKGGGSTPTPTTWDYSTTETDTHQKWIDGKEIYCKVINGTFTFPSNLGTVTILADASELETIIDVSAISTKSDNTVASCANPMCFVDSGALKGINFGQFISSAIILFYTKVTPAKTTKRSKKA